MSSRPDTENERDRQQALDRLEIDAFRDTALDDIVRMAAETFEVPIALVSIVDGDRQWFKSRVGLTATETPREWAFCAHAIETPGQVMVVEDALEDPRFADNPLVTGGPKIRFYAGAPLVTGSGHAVGTVCVIDAKPRHVDVEKLESLRFMAQQVMTTLESRRKTRSSESS